MFKTIMSPHHFILAIFLVVSIACNMPLISNTGGEISPADSEFTQTVPPQPSPFTITPSPITPSTTISVTAPAIPVTNTMTSTATEVPPTSTSTTIPVPCNRAQFVSDVNYPDGAQVTVTTGFTKTWRLINTGSCPWTSGYRIIFDSGDRMGAPDETVLTGDSIPSGAAADISVPLTAPGTAGNYRGYFRLKSPDNGIFGINASGTDAFWVEINAIKFEVSLPKVPIFVVPSSTPVSKFKLNPKYIVTLKFP